MTAEHEHAFVKLREVHAPTGPAPEHTTFLVLVCPCGIMRVFPDQNFQLTTAAFQFSFRADMAALGFTLKDGQ